ncbi:MAG: tripartite tricarboxylate transporter substrate binding protein [Spirochaetales bacterium]|nr:tripartite tricarboxylate transporter substrate binding protein [Spirochaetales bacterium]
MKKLRVLTFLMVLLPVLMFASGQDENQAEDNYPSKPITLIVPSSAGGGTDAMARLFAEIAKDKIGQNFVIVNKSGAGGQIGFEAIADATPDGYTIGAAFTPHIGAHMAAGRAKYTLDSFLPLANYVTDPGVLVANINSNFKTLEDVVNAEKADPGSLTGATTGPGGDDSFALVGFNHAAGIGIREVPSKGSSEEKVNIMGGHVDLAFMNFSQIEANYRAGDVRILAVMVPERLSYAQEIPTFTELGYEVYSDSSRGFIAPAGIPEAAYNKLVKVFSEVVEDPKFLEAAKGQLLLNYMNAKDYSKYLESVKVSTESAFAKNPW